MRINHNIAALNTYRQLSGSNAAQGKSMEKLSSGLRINRAGDDAAGLAISEKMRGQIRGLDQASANAQDGISLIQTAEGALSETHSILQRMRELSVQSGNDTNTDADRKEIQKEVNQLTDEIDRIATTTEFNTKKLLDGTKKGVSTATTGTATFEQSNTAANFTLTTVTVGLQTTSDTIRVRKTDTGTFSVSNALNNITVTAGTGTAAGTLKIGTATLGTFTDANFNVGDTLTISITGGEAANTSDTALKLQIGANTAQEMSVDIKDMGAEALGVKKSDGTKLDVSTQFGAAASISRLDEAISKVSAERSKLGSFQNRLEHTINNLGTSSENLTAAESRIRDVDYALAA
ncbi:flagellin [Niallia oryzisoli]|uniref:flagellin N-terminal helical domain-containing protein n=1 Tax=Niallia oryzisoli TaxID=1737571 RepID=UPI0037368C68